MSGFQKPLESNGYLVPEQMNGRWRGAPKTDRDNFKWPSLDDVMAGRRPANITIVGHSFIERLLNQLRDDLGPDNNFGISSTLANVSYIAKGGKKMAHFTKENILSHKPDIVYFEMGSNDLTELEITGQSMGRKVYELALELISNGVSEDLLLHH